MLQWLRSFQEQLQPQVEALLPNLGTWLNIRESCLPKLVIAGLPTNDLNGLFCVLKSGYRPAVPILARPTPNQHSHGAQVCRKTERCNRQVPTFCQCALYFPVSQSGRREISQTTHPPPGNIRMCLPCISA